jgi:hypothetical protein
MKLLILECRKITNFSYHIYLMGICIIDTLQDTKYFKLPQMSNETAHNKHLCKEITISSGHRCLMELHTIDTYEGKLIS